MGNSEFEYAISEAEGSSAGLLMMWDKEEFKANMTNITFLSLDQTVLCAL